MVLDWCVAFVLSPPPRVPDAAPGVSPQTSVEVSFPFAIVEEESERGKLIIRRMPALQGGLCLRPGGGGEETRRTSDSSAFLLL